MVMQAVNKCRHSLTEYLVTSAMGCVIFLLKKDMEVICERMKLYNTLYLVQVVSESM